MILLKGIQHYKVLWLCAVRRSHLCLPCFVRSWRCRIQNTLATPRVSTQRLAGVSDPDAHAHRGENAVLPVLGKMNPRRLWFAHHRGLRKRVLVSFRLKDRIRVIESEIRGQDAEPKDSVDQGSRVLMLHMKSWQKHVFIGGQYHYFNR